MAWLYLIFAGVFEIGWPVGLKLSQTPGKIIPGVIMAATCIGVSGWLLWTAQKSIPMGTAYAVWTSIGAAGTFLLGIALYGDSASPMRFLAVGLILVGVIILKLAH